MQAVQEEVQWAEAVLLQILSKIHRLRRDWEPGKSLLAEPQSCRDANHTEKSPATTCCPRIPSIRCTANSDLIPEPDGVRKEEPRPLRQKRFLWRGVYAHNHPRGPRRRGAACPLHTTHPHTP